MIPNDFNAPKEEKKVYPPLPKNVYQVQCLAIDLKDATGKFAKEGEKNLAFQFTVLDGSDGKESLRGRNVWANFVPTTLYIGKNGKNELYQVVEAFIGREMSQAEEAAGAGGELINSFIGEQCKIFVDHKPSKSDPTKVFDNITSYMPVAEGEKLNALTAEEVEEATVKNKKDAPVPTAGEQAPLPPDEPVIDIEDDGVPITEEEMPV